MAPWDVLNSWGGHKVPGLVKSSLKHHLTMKFCIYPQDALGVIRESITSQGAGADRVKYCSTLFELDYLFVAYL